MCKITVTVLVIIIESHPFFLLHRKRSNLIYLICWHILLLDLFQSQLDCWICFKITCWFEYIYLWNTHLNKQEFYFLENQYLHQLLWINTLSHNKYITATHRRSSKLSIQLTEGLPNSPKHALMQESNLFSAFFGEIFPSSISTTQSHLTSFINYTKAFLKTSSPGFGLHVEMQRLMLSAVACLLITTSDCSWKKFQASLMLLGQNMIKSQDFFWH